MAAVSGVRCAQGIARPFCPLRSTLTPDTAAKALASRFNRAPHVAARPETKNQNERPNMFAQNDNPLSVHSRAELPDDQLRALAPSVFASQAIPGVRYAKVEVMARYWIRAVIRRGVVRRKLLITTGCRGTGDRPLWAETDHPWLGAD